MPWQGDLFVGQVVTSNEEAKAVYKALGIQAFIWDRHH